MSLNRTSINYGTLVWFWECHTCIIINNATVDLFSFFSAFLSATENDAKEYKHWQEKEGQYYLTEIRNLTEKKESLWANDDEKRQV